MVSGQWESAGGRQRRARQLAIRITARRADLGEYQLGEGREDG
jgi:hypothetical protein